MSEFTPLSSPERKPIMVFDETVLDYFEERMRHYAESFSARMEDPNDISILMSVLDEQRLRFTDIPPDLMDDLMDIEERLTLNYFS